MIHWPSLVVEMRPFDFCYLCRVVPKYTSARDNPGSCDNVNVAQYDSRGRWRGLYALVLRKLPSILSKRECFGRNKPANNQQIKHQHAVALSSDAYMVMWQQLYSYFFFLISCLLDLLCHMKNEGRTVQRLM